MFEVVGIKLVPANCEVDRVQVDGELKSRRWGEDAELFTSIPKMVKGASQAFTVISGVANVDSARAKLKGNGHAAPKLSAVLFKQTVAFNVVVFIFECSKCGVDESIVDDVFHFVEDIVTEEIDWSSRDGCSVNGGRDFWVHVENGIVIIVNR